MIVLGRYREIYNSDEYPCITDDINNVSEYKDEVLNYMKKCKSSSASPAILRDVISGENINIPLECKSDGVYGWRTDYMYYIDKYNLKIPTEFINHVINATA